MADPRHHDLPYGKFGQANYDPEQYLWTFERSEDAGDRFHVLGPPKLIVGATAQAPGLITSRSSQPSVRHPQQIQALVKRFPDLQPASDILPDHLRLSEAVEAAVDRHDAQKGNLLDFGTIVSEASGHAITIAAFPCGPTGSNLRLVHVQPQKRGWDDTKSAWLEIPVIHGEEAVWSGPGAAIQQVCFAKAIDRADRFLAVRMLARTLLFRPILRKTPTSSSGASRLDSNFRVELPLSESSSMPHADVCFNPWFTRQCAVVGQTGHWEVFEFQDRHSTVIKRLCWPAPAPTTPDYFRVLFDGWGRVTWVANLSTIAVASRKTVSIHDITTVGEIINATSLIDLYGSDHWILDMATLPSHPSYLCLLTSTHILLYYLDVSPPGSSGFWSVERVKHFRNPNDITLRFSSFVLGDRLAIILRSDMDPIVAVYTLKFDDQNGVHFTVPTELDIMPASTPQQRASAIAGLRLEELGLGTRPQVTNDSLAIRLRESGITFASLTVLGRDLSVQQTVLYILSLGHRSQVPLLTWASRPGSTSMRLRKETFVAEDDETDLLEVDDTIGRPISAFVRRKLLANTTRTDREWTLPLRCIADDLQTPASSDLSSIIDVLEATEVHLGVKQDEEILPWRVLADLTPSELTLPDIDEAQDRVEALMSSTAVEMQNTPEDATEAATPVSVVVANIASETIGDISDVHAAIAEDWITPLPSSVIGRVRLAKEQLARRMAAEIVLAARLLRAETPIPDSQTESQPTQESFDIPVRGGPSTGDPPASSQVASQPSVLPTPSPSATPSLMTASSHPSSFAALEVSRLSRYTTIPRPPTTALPRSLNNVLSHWSIGTNPADYDWRSTSRKLAQYDNEQTEEQMTEKERLRVQRRAERHIKRQRREAAASQAQQFASSQAPEIFSASQPQQVQRKVESQPSGVAASSQSVGFGGMPASQVVPGRFGGRPPKKKRKQGF